MRKILLYVLPVAMMTLLMSCSRKGGVANGGGTMYLEFGANSGESKISYEGTSFKWSSADELSCYAGTMQNAKFYNKYQNETSSAVFACDNATDWGTADFYTIYPYKEGGYTISEGKLSVTVPTTVAVGENDYSGTMLFGKASSITPSQLYNTPVTLNQVFSIVKVKIPAVTGEKATSVTISNSDAHLYGRTLYKSGKIDAAGNWTVGDPIGYVEYQLSGTSYGTEAVVNLPVIPTTTGATYNVTVQYTNGTKLSTIYAKPINSGVSLSFEKNKIYKIGFNDSGSKAPNQKYKYTVFDYITNENASNNYIDTGLAFDRNYTVVITFGTTEFLSNRWYIGHMYDGVSVYDGGFEIGEFEYNASGKCYWIFDNGTTHTEKYQPYQYKLVYDCTYRYRTGESGNMIFLNRGHNGYVNTNTSSFKCYYLKINEKDGPMLLNYVPVRNNTGKSSMFNLVTGSFCVVKDVNGHDENNNLETN